MIQITKKNAQLLFNQNEKKNEISRSFDQLACAFPQKIFEDKVKSESFDQFAKTNQQNEQNETMKQRTAVYYSLLWILVKESTQMNTKETYLQFAVDHLR